MIGFEQSTLPVTEGIGGCSSVPPNFGPGLTTAVTPSSCSMKSMCHQSRRISPSVTACSPIDSCRAMASLMQRSSTAPSFLPFKVFLASASSLGLSRLPTWSALNGGFIPRT
jgi:hypothetical protein